MKALHEKILSNHDTPVTVSSIAFTPQMNNRRFKTLNKNHLQIEEEENARQMEKKMVKEAMTEYWTCRDCNWRGKYSHKAKAHARDCGQRKRVNKRNIYKNKFDCSYPDCDASFALKSQLLYHYR